MSQLSEGQTLNLLQALYELDGQADTISASKRDLLKDAREQMHGMTRAEINAVVSALKKAVSDTRKARLKPEAVEAEEARDELAEQYKALLASGSARRATHAVGIDWSAVKSLRNTNSEAA
jgi:Spy/CpxP family protein refolding chaperone